MIDMIQLADKLITSVFRTKEKERLWSYDYVIDCRTSF